MEKDSNPNISASTQGGAHIEHVYAGRKMKVFAVTEPEFDTINYMNTATIVACGIGGALFSLAFSFSAKSPIFWTLGAVSIAFFLAAAFAMYLKSKTVTKIKESSISNASV